MLRASPDFSSCYNFDAGGYDFACADGFSEPVRVEVPKPAIRYAAAAEVLTYSKLVYLKLTATPLGEKLAYRLCYQPPSRRRRCLSATLDGYSWNSGASDTVSVSTRGLAAITQSPGTSAERSSPGKRRARAS